MSKSDTDSDGQFTYIFVANFIVVISFSSENAHTTGNDVKGLEVFWRMKENLLVISL